MAHNLFGTRFYGRKEPAWHNLGKVFPADRKLDLITAFEEGGLNYTIEVWEAMCRKDSESPSFVIPDRYEIVRYPTVDDPVYQTLGQVSDQYKLITNQDIAYIYNDLSNIWPVETVGALGKGETIFVALDCGEVEINGEILHQYFVITDNKIGKEGTQGFYCAVRVVCQNTLMMGMNQARVKFNVMHKGNNIEKLNQIAKLQEQMQTSIDETNKLFSGLGKAHFSLTEFEKLVKDILYPLPKKEENTDVTEEFEKLFQKQQLEQSKVMNLYEQYNDENKNQNTKWLAYNVITEWENYKPGKGIGQYKSVLFGQRADKMGEAFNYLLKGKN